MQQLASWLSPLLVKSVLLSHFFHSGAKRSSLKLVQDVFNVNTGLKEFLRFTARHCHGQQFRKTESATCRTSSCLEVIHCLCSCFAQSSMSCLLFCVEAAVLLLSGRFFDHPNLKMLIKLLSFFSKNKYMNPVFIHRNCTEHKPDTVFFFFNMYTLYCYFTGNMLGSNVQNAQFSNRFLCYELSFNDFHCIILYIKYLHLFKETILNIKHLESFM